MQIETWPGQTPYDTALSRQEAAVAGVLKNGGERAFFLEHPPCFTVGSSGHMQEVLDAADIPVYQSGRGGKVTYHGPGQRVVYLIKDLRGRKDIRAYIKDIQQWLIATLAELRVEAFSNDDVGVWVRTPAGEAKIAAIGIRVRKWVAFHGVALNVAPDLEMYRRIIPCGIEDRGITSLAALGLTADMQQVDEALVRNLGKFLPPVS